MDPGSLVAERFLLEREAGGGAMGVVWRALDRLSGAPVALKILRGGIDDDRFAREARALAELAHPGVVRYVAHGTAPDGTGWLAMEWIEGETLGARLRRGGLAPDETLALARRVAGALAEAHGRGLVHRDLKPSNLMLPGGRLADAKLLDFGVVRFAWATHSASRPGALLGTPGYIAPEQALGERDVDARADVFSLGCVLYECVAARAAFRAEHLVALLAKVLLEEPPRLRDVAPEAPEALDALIGRMLAKEPSGRPRDGAAVLRELETLGSFAPAAPHAPGRRIDALGADEQRVLSVVLVGASPAARSAEASAPAPTVEEPAGTVAALRRMVEGFGGRLERLRDGSVMTTVSRVGPAGGAATDQAGRAARCALALAAIYDDAPIAVATGRAELAGRWPVGEVVDRAARLLGAPGTVRVDEVTAGLLDARFEVTPGPDGPLLRGERPMEQTRRLLGRPAPFVGRDRELAVLLGLFEECAAEPGARVVLVTGAPGVGKSRLRHELLLRIGARAQVLAGAGDALRAGAPYWLLAHALRDAFGVRDGEPADRRGERIRARVARHAPAADADRIAWFLGELCGTPFPGDAGAPLRAARSDPALMADQVRRALEDFLGAELAGAGPLVLVLEDLHWSALPTVRLVDAALRALRDRPFFVLALARPEVHDLFPHLWAERGAQQLRLGELSRRAGERLVREVLGGALGAERVARLVDRAGGNAFFLEELIRAEADQPGGGPAVESGPGTVLAMVQARLEALPGDARRALRAASIFGATFWSGGVETLLGAAPGAAAGALGELAERELIHARPTSRFVGQNEYAFRHDLVREAAHAMLTAADRTLGHRLAAAWLAAAGETGEALLAEHHERGEEPARAAVRWVAAARAALRGHDFDGAVAQAARARARGAEGPLAGTALLVEAEAQRWSGRNGEALRAATAAMELLPHAGAEWAAALSERIMAAGKLGDAGAVAALAEQLLAVWGGALPELLGLLPAVSAMHLLRLAGRQALADALFVRIDAVRASAPADDQYLQGRLHLARGTHALFAGDVGAYLDGMVAGGAAYETAGNLRMVWASRGNAGWAHFLLGDYQAAEQLLREALAGAERLGTQNVAAGVRVSLGRVLARVGRLADARAADEAAVAEMRAQGDHRLEAVARLYLAEVHELEGDGAAAERETRAAIAALADVPAMLPLARATLARQLLARGAATEALAAAAAARAALDDAPVEEGEALVRLVHAEALAATGDRAAAAAALAAARTRLLARAARVADPALRARFLEAVPENARTLALAQALPGAA